MSEDKGI